MCTVALCDIGTVVLAVTMTNVVFTAASLQFVD